MEWIKKGLIFAPAGNRPWMQTHASLPVADRREHFLRIYFGTRDSSGESHIGYVDVNPEHPERILRISDEPVLPLGQLGTFDDSGIMPSSLVKHEGRKYLFYIGWNPQVKVSYRLSIGLAISDDDGDTFVKRSEGPVADRSTDEPFFNTAPCVIVENSIWRMWYISCTGWEIVNGWPEPRYHVKYAESSDGVNWRKTGIVCIDYDEFTAAIGRPCVIKQLDIYRMYYSYRRLEEYRHNPDNAYRLGYAESLDGISWSRKDDEVGIARSVSGWDSEMLEYCSLYRDGDRSVMLYNGNGFGKSGFGYAISS